MTQKSERDKNPPECAEHEEIIPVSGKRHSPLIGSGKKSQLRKAVQLLRSGELTLQETDKIEEHFATFPRDREVYWNNPQKGSGFYQAITREFIEALFQYLTLLGRGRVIEIGVDDGRLSTALRKRGLNVVATDNGSWGTSSQSEVIVIDVKDASQKADILIFSWLPLSNVSHSKGEIFEPPDLALSKIVRFDPKKTFILLGALCTGSSEFWANVMGISRPQYIEKEGKMITENPDYFFKPPPQITVPLQQHKPRGLNHIIGADGNFYQLGRSWEKNFSRSDGSFALVLRSPEAPRIPSMEPLHLKDYVPPTSYQITQEDPLVNHVLVPKDHLWR